MLRSLGYLVRGKPNENARYNASGWHWTKGRCTGRLRDPVLFGAVLGKTGTNPVKDGGVSALAGMAFTRDHGPVLYAIFNSRWQYHGISTLAGRFLKEPNRGKWGCGRFCSLPWRAIAHQHFFVLGSLRVTGAVWAKNLTSNLSSRKSKILTTEILQSTSPYQLPPYWQLDKGVKHAALICQ